MTMIMTKTMTVDCQVNAIYVMFCVSIASTVDYYYMHTIAICLSLIVASCVFIAMFFFFALRDGRQIVSILQGALMAPNSSVVDPLMLHGNAL